MATYLSRATLESRLTLVGLTALASTTGALAAGDETRIDEVLEDISGRIDSVIAGLGVDTATPPRALEDIALDFAKAELWERTWAPLGLIREDLKTLAIEAEERLEKFAKGWRSGDPSVNPGAVNAGRMSWVDIQSNPSAANPRQNLRAKFGRQFPI